MKAFFQIPQEGALLVLWITSLCSYLCGVSKKNVEGKLSIAVLGKSFHMLRCASLLYFPEYEELLHENRLLFKSFSFAGSLHASLPFSGCQLHISCKNFAECPRLADLADLTGIGKHGVN